MTENQTKIIIEQQNYLKAYSHIDYQCYYANLSEYDFWQHYLWNYLLAKYGIKSSLGIGDNDYSEGVRFEE